MSGLSPVSLSSNGGGHAVVKKERLSTSSIFLSFLLTVVLVGLGQRGLYDLNRIYNPHYQACNQVSYLTTGGSSCAIETYAFKQVLLHSYLSLPLFLVFLGFMLYLRNRRLTTWQRAMYRVSATVSIFFGVEFLIETIIYLFQYHRIFGWYFFLGVSAILLIMLVIIIERRKIKAQLSGSHH